jgi:hypothetical protein
LSGVVPQSAPRPPQGRRERGGVFRTLMVGTEPRTLNLELRTSKSRPKPPKATPEPPSSQLLGRGLRPTSHLQATLKPPPCDPYATLMRPSCDPQATLKPPSSHPQAAYCGSARAFSAAGLPARDRGGKARDLYPQDAAPNLRLAFPAQCRATTLPPRSRRGRLGLQQRLSVAAGSLALAA